MQTIRIRSPDGVTFSVEATNNEQVTDVIERLAAQQGYIARTVRLVLRGEVIPKDSSLGRLHIGHNDILVVVGSRDTEIAAVTEAERPPIESCFPRLQQSGYSMEQITDALEHLPPNPPISELLQQLKECRAQSLVSVLTGRGYNEADVREVINSLPQQAPLATIEQALQKKPPTETLESKKDDLLSSGYDCTLINTIFANEPTYYNLPLGELKQELTMMEQLLPDYPLADILRCFADYAALNESDRSGDKVGYVHTSMLSAPPPPPSSMEDVIAELVDNQGLDKLIVAEVVESSPEGTSLTELASLVEERQRELQLENTQRHLIDDLGFESDLVMSLTQGAFDTPVEELVQTLRMVSEAPIHSDPVPECNAPPLSQFEADVESILAMTDDKWTREGVESVLREVNGNINLAIQNIFPDS